MFKTVLFQKVAVELPSPLSRPVRSGRQGLRREEVVEVRQLHEVRRGVPPAAARRGEAELHQVVQGGLLVDESQAERCRHLLVRVHQGPAGGRRLGGRRGGGRRGGGRRADGRRGRGRRGGGRRGRGRPTVGRRRRGRRGGGRRGRGRGCRRRRRGRRHGGDGRRGGRRGVLSDCARAAEAEHGGVIDGLGLLGGVEGAKPDAPPQLRVADLRRILAPRPAPHAAQSPGRPSPRGPIIPAARHQRTRLAGRGRPQPLLARPVGGAAHRTRRGGRKREPARQADLPHASPRAASLRPVRLLVGVVGGIRVQKVHADDAAGGAAAVASGEPPATVHHRREWTAASPDFISWQRTSGFGGAPLLVGCGFGRVLERERIGWGSALLSLSPTVNRGRGWNG
uniref:Uncharacterized protein n=1 Tax=Triticum urartu TaxID=4572 RepID=A0A8R7Q3R7_TRIUA